MTKSSEILHFSALSLAEICMAAFIYAAVGLFFEINFVLWFLITVGTHIVNLFLAERGVSAIFYVVLNAACILLGTALPILGADFSDIFNSPLIFQIMFATIIGFHAACMPFDIPNVDLHIHFVDVLTIMSGLSLMIAFLMDSNPDQQLIIFALSAVVFNLIIAGHIRTSCESSSIIRGFGGTSLFLIVCIIILILFIAGIVNAYGSGTLSSLTMILAAAALFVFRIVEFILTLFACAVGYTILFFSRLFPSKGSAAYEESFSPPDFLNDEIVRESTVMHPEVLLVMAVILIGAALFMLRRVRLGRMGMQRRRVQRVTKKSLLGESIRNFFSALFARAHYEYAYLKNRDTLSGLLVYTERHFRLTKLRRTRKESAEAFLTRLSMETGLAEFRKLADLTELEFYAGKSADESIDKKEIIRVRRLIAQL